MKNVKVAQAMILSSALFSFCSGQNVPQNVKNAFEKKFPTAKSVKWEKESDNEWEAEFKMNKVEYSANFGNDGMWMETEHEIAESEMPMAVKMSLNKNFRGYNVVEMEISEKASGMLYEFEVEKGSSKMEVALDASGKVVKKEMKSKEDKEEKEDND